MSLLGTLALGINAPAKSSVFCGDSPFLTALTVSIHEKSCFLHTYLYQTRSIVNVRVVRVVEVSTY